MVLIIRNSYIIDKLDLKDDHRIRPNNLVFLLVELAIQSLKGGGL